MILSRYLNKDYAVDLVLFHKLRQFSDGITFCQFEFNWDKYEDDHKPSLMLRLELFNYTLFELEVYNVHHIEE